MHVAAAVPSKCHVSTSVAGACSKCHVRLQVTKACSCETPQGNLTLKRYVTELATAQVPSLASARRRGRGQARAGTVN